MDKGGSRAGGRGLAPSQLISWTIPSSWESLCVKKNLELFKNLERTIKARTQPQHKAVLCVTLEKLYWSDSKDYDASVENGFEEPGGLRAEGSAFLTTRENPPPKQVYEFKKNYRLLIGSQKKASGKPPLVWLDPATPPPPRNGHPWQKGFGCGAADETGLTGGERIAWACCRRAGEGWPPACLGIKND